MEIVGLETLLEVVAAVGEILVPLGDKDPSGFSFPFSCSDPCAVTEPWAGADSGWEFPGLEVLAPELTLCSPASLVCRRVGDVPLFAAASAMRSDNLFLFRKRKESKLPDGAV